MLSSLEDDAQLLCENQEKIQILAERIALLLPDAFIGSIADQSKVVKYLAFIARWSTSEKEHANAHTS